MENWSETLAAALKRNGVRMIAHVPDEVTAHLLDRLSADPEITVVPCTREEEGVAVLAGGYLGGQKGALVLQGSGVGNSLNALGSLALAYQIPMLLIISERGRLGEFNPAQVPLGRAIPRILETLGIQYFSVEDATRVDDLVAGASDLAFSGSLPVALGLSTLLTGGKTLR
jgi:sulfopyruvate decarboxylase alpha subunit